MNEQHQAATALILEVFRLNAALTAAGDRLVADLGLTSARWQLLGAVALAGQPQTQAGIARELGLSRQAVRRLAEELRHDGLIAYRDNPAHRRAKLLHLTAAGRAALEAAGERQRPWALDLTEGLGTADLRAANSLARRLRRRLEGQSAAAGASG